MIKKIAWDTFKNTGDINSFLELVEIENVEKNLEENPQLMEIEKTEKIKNNLTTNEPINDNAEKRMEL